MSHVKVQSGLYQDEPVVRMTLELDDEGPDLDLGMLTPGEAHMIALDLIAAAEASVHDCLVAIYAQENDLDPAELLARFSALRDEIPGSYRNEHD